MAITQDELNSIVSAVLSSIRTNSKTIEQMTPATSLGETDYFEVSGGKKVSYSVLKELIGSMSTEDQDSLRTQIEQAKLKSVSIATTETSATLTIQSVGKTISCTIPIASTSSGGLMSAADKVKVNSAYDLANSAKTTADNALSLANDASNTAGGASQKADNANTIAMSAKTTAEAAKAVTDTKGFANGIAPLDEAGLIPQNNIPGKFDDVVEFKGFITMLSSAQMQSYGGLSTDDNCAVLFDRSESVFIIRVETVSGTGKQTISYYNNWADGSSFGEGTLEGRVPEKGKVYVDTTSNKTYRWSGSEMVVIGSDLALGHTETTAFPGNEGAELQEIAASHQQRINENSTHIDNIGILAADGEWNGIGEEPTFGVWLCDAGDGEVYWRSFGSTEFYGYAEEAYNPDMANELCIYRIKNELYRINNGKLMSLAGSAVGNCYNVTNEVPITDGTNPYYNLQSAIETTFANGLNKIGMQITFAISDKIWKTYQYIGSTTKQADFIDVDNWKDFGSLAAGSETVIVIDNLCGAPLIGDYYTLETAVSRLVEYQEKAGVTYIKKGLIISYRTAENVMETKQFQGEISGFSEVGLWKDFGGGTDVLTSDTPEKDGTEALSTGGAYTHLPAGLNIDTETEGVVKMKLVNAEGDDIGDEVQFSVGTGSGGYTGTTIAVAFQENPFYGKANGDFKLKAAIMSVTKVGSQETSNSIASVTFINRTTKNSVAFFKPRQASSATLTDYSFEFDLSSVCAGAGEYSLQAVVTDDGGNTATKNISIVSIDVTCESVQTLNYTKETSLQVGGPKTSIPMYRFPNNASDRGISTIVEMYMNGEWVKLQETIINDTYPHNVSIDPTGLGHGAYPIRIQGTDVASGTKGNVLHTAVMVIEQRESVADYNKPIVVARWSDDSEGKMQLFESITFDIACYQRSNVNPTVNVVLNNTTKGTSETLTSREMARTKYYSIEKRLVGYSNGDVLEFDAICDEIHLVEPIQTTIEGSLLDIAETEGAYYKISLDGRSNTDTDKTIKTTATDGTEIRIDVTGANYSSNGFVADNFGTEQAEGRMALRIAENVEAVCTDQPFASPFIVQNGLALSITCKIKNIAKRDARIMSCIGERLGFVMTGEKFIVTLNSATLLQI